MVRVHQHKTAQSGSAVIMFDKKMNQLANEYKAQVRPKLLPNAIVGNEKVFFLTLSGQRITNIAARTATIGKHLGFKVFTPGEVRRSWATHATLKKKNLRSLLLKVARHHFGLLYTLHSGVLKMHKSFWQKLGVDKLCLLYKAMNFNTESVFQLIEEPEFCSKAEERVFNYLMCFISSCKPDELRSFLRFVTGSTIILSQFRLTVSLE